MTKRAFIPYLLSLALILSGCGGSSDPAERAINLGRSEDIKKLIQEGLDPNGVRGANNSPLIHLAARKKRPEIMSLLLEAGADPNAKDGKGATAWDQIWDEKRKGYSDWDTGCLLALLEAKVILPKVEREDGQQWIHALLGSCDSSRMVVVLKENYEMDLNLPDANGWTPLHHAAFNGQYDTVQGLILGKAEINAETTKDIVDSYVKGETTMVRYRYEAGSRPTDLADNVPFTRSRIGKDIGELLEEHGGEKNPAIKNKYVR